MILAIIIIGGVPALAAGATIGYLFPMTPATRRWVGPLGIAFAVLGWSVLFLYSLALPPIWLGMFLVGYSLGTGISPRPIAVRKPAYMPPGRARRYRTKHAGDQRG